MTSPTKSFFDKKTLGVFLFFFVLYSYFLNMAMPTGSGPIINATISLTDKGNFEVDRNFDATFYNGKFYSGFPPGATLLAVPIYVITKPLIGFLNPFFARFIPIYQYPSTAASFNVVRPDFLSLNFLCALFIAIPLSCLLIVLFYKTLGEFSNNERHKLLATISLGVGTMLFFYSTLYYTGALGMFCLFASFYILFKIKLGKIDVKFLPLAGFLAASVVLFHYLQIPIAILLFFYLLTFIRDKRLLLFIAGAIVPAAIVLLYHWKVFGNPFLTPYNLRITPTNGLAPGYLGLTYPHLKTLYMLTFSAYRGLFVFAPVLLLALRGLILKIKSKWKPEMLLVLSVFLVSLIINSAMQEQTNWSGGMLPGPRHLLAAVPFLMLPLIFVFEKIKSRIFNFGIILIISLSIFINYLNLNACNIGNSCDIKNAALTLIKNGPTENVIFTYLHAFVKNGVSNSFFGSIFTSHLLIINVAGLAVLITILYIIWRTMIRPPKTIN